MGEGSVSVAVLFFSTPSLLCVLCFVDSADEDNGSGLHFDFMMLPCMLLLLLQRPKPTDPLCLLAVCWTGPGLILAQSSLWLACAMSLAVFDIEKYVNEFGNAVEPKIHYTDGTIR